MGAAATWPSQLSRIALRLGIHAVRIERPADICNQTVGQVADHVVSEYLWRKL